MMAVRRGGSSECGPGARNGERRSKGGPGREGSAEVIGRRGRTGMRMARRSEHAERVLHECLYPTPHYPLLLRRRTPLWGLVRLLFGEVKAVISNDCHVELVLLP